MQMNRIINLTPDDIRPHRNDFACIDCKHSHWYTGCHGATIEHNNSILEAFEQDKIKSNYSAQEFLVKESSTVNNYIEKSYREKDEQFKSLTTLEQFIGKFKQDELLKIAAHFLNELKKRVQEGPKLRPENVILVCYCKALYKETFNTDSSNRTYFHMTACEAKPGMLKEGE